MRATSILAASAALLFSASAFAQSTPPATQHGPGAGTAPAAAVHTPKPNPLMQADVNKIEGAEVLGRDGKKIGDVSTVLMQPQDKKIDQLVVHTGGVLGIGGRYVALPVTAFNWDSNKDAFTIDKTANDVKYLAEWKGSSSTATETGSSAPAGKAAVPPANAGK